jgi:hypothetical protein
VKDWAGIRQACGFNHQPIERPDRAPIALVEQFAHRVGEVIAKTAAHATVADQRGRFVGLAKEMMVDSNLAELVDDQR